MVKNEEDECGEAHCQLNNCPLARQIVFDWIDDISEIEEEKESSMRTLVFGAGPLGCLYTYLLTQAGKDVTLLARGQRYDWIKANGLVLVFALHAAAARDEMKELTAEFQSLIDQTSIETPNIDTLKDDVP